MRVPAVLRAVVLVLLAAALLVPALWRPAPADEAPRAVVLRADEAVERIDSLLLAPPPAVVGRAAAGPPTEAELDVLAALARRAPLYASAPADARWLTVEAPVLPRAGRAAAVGFRLRAAPGDSVTLRIADETGALDSLRTSADESGEVAGAFRVRPPQSGWREWRVTAGGRSARTGAYVDSAGAPRVWVRAGLPHWEASFLVRALEEAGAAVETAFDLGRGQAVAQGDVGALTDERLARFDVVVQLDGAPATAAELRRLADWAAAGGGIVATGAHTAATAFALTPGTTRQTPLQVEAIRWDVPAELAALPAASFRSAGVVAGTAHPGAAVAAIAGGDPVLTLRPLGRGRAAGLALVETWRWRMEAGRMEEHREFWRSLVDWAAAAPPPGPVAHVPTPFGIVGVPREVVVYAAGEERPHAVAVRPDGGADTVELHPVPGRSGVWHGSVVPADTGAFLIQIDGGSVAGFTAAANPDADGGWARLALLASGSGGGMVAEDSLRSAMQRFASGSPDGRGLPLAWLLFAAILATAGAEWLLRRLAGQP
jgi:hypothetical protein